MTYEGTETVGDALGNARRQAGLTITQVSQRTCIRETIVRGIERGDYTACGGDFYARGHVRSIARAVGLDPDQMVDWYDHTQAPPAPITAAEVFQPFTPVKLRERRRPNWAALLAAGVIVLAALAGLRVATDHHAARPVHVAGGPHAAHPAAVTPSVSPAPAAQASPSVSPSAGQVQVTIVAHPGSTTFAQETAPNGQVLFQGTIGTGSALMQQSSTTATQMQVQISNPKGADLYLNGKKVNEPQTQAVTLTCTTSSCS